MKIFNEGRKGVILGYDRLSTVDILHDRSIRLNGLVICGFVTYFSPTTRWGRLSAFQHSSIVAAHQQASVAVWSHQRPIPVLTLILQSINLRSIDIGFP